ncbi:MAG: flagellar brake protein [Gammaproteobacteria bacterium]
MADTPETDPPSAYQGKTEKVTQAPQIIGLLRRLRDQRTLLSVRVPGHQGVFNSLLLEVDPERNLILLDELNPRAGHEQALAARRLQVHSQSQGIELSFACTVEIGVGQSGIAFYRAALPESIDYLQRRGSYRVRVGMNLAVPVQMPMAETLTLEGELLDLSMGGLGASLEAKSPLAQGQLLTCIIQLPKADPLQVEIEIRFARADPHKPTQRIGASFRNLLPPQQAQLRRLVTQLEREMLRRKARG